ncbi:MAG: hypothetical protein WBB01_18810 [Phormidesmis sp.]
MTVLSLKGILMSFLHWFSTSEYGALREDLTRPLQSATKLPCALSQLNPTQYLDSDIDWQTISIIQKQDASSVLYISALPQKLAEKYNPKKGLTLLAISQQTVQQLNQARQKLSRNNLCALADKSLDSILSCQLWREFEIETQRPGWISFHLSNRGVALWLQHVQQDLLCLPAAGSHQDRLHLAGQRLTHAETNAVWQMQYTYARCCTLLKLWQETQSDLPASTDLSWLTDSHQLRVSAPQALQLIQTLIATADDVFWIPYRWPDRQYALLLKRAARLCQSFDGFYRGCLYGFSQGSSTAGPLEKQFKARFGLVAATRNLLRVLLCEHFEAPSPASL